MKKSLQGKLNHLKQLLHQMQSVGIAFSGGVDSTLLLKIAVTELGDRAVALYSDSVLQPARERKGIKNLAEEIGARLIVLEGVDLKQTAFKNNPENRCYLCKGLIFDRIIDTAQEHQLNFILDGSNTDDNKDYRPGKKALRERGVRSPLQEANLSKSEIRELSKHYNLPTWDKDALACLATRIPFNSSVTAEKLKIIDQVEEFLVNMDFRNVRARLRNNEIRIEVRSDQIQKLKNKVVIEQLKNAVIELKKYTVNIDEAGYQQGNMNKVVS